VLTKSNLKRRCVVALTILVVVFINARSALAVPAHKALSATERCILSCARISFPADKPVEQRSFFTTGFLVHEDKSECIILISAMHCFELCKADTVCLDVAQIAAETHSKGKELQVQIREGEKPLWIQPNKKEDIAYITLDPKCVSRLEKETLISTSELIENDFRKTVEVRQVLVPCYPHGATAMGTLMPIVRRGTLTIYSDSCTDNGALKMQLDYASFLGTSGAPVFETDSKDEQVRVLGIVTTLLVGDKTVPPTDLRLADVISVDSLVKSLAAK
jgi:hypothetical protein